jgi:TctA family transporter
VTVCMYACMYAVVCMCNCIYLSTLVAIYVYVTCNCIYTYIYIYIYIYIHTCVCVCVCVNRRTRTCLVYVCMYLRFCVCGMYVRGNTKYVKELVTTKDVNASEYVTFILFRLKFCTECSGVSSHSHTTRHSFALY